MRECCPRQRHPAANSSCTCAQPYAHRHSHVCACVCGVSTWDHVAAPPRKRAQKATAALMNATVNRVPRSRRRQQQQQQQQQKPPQQQQQQPTCTKIITNIQPADATRTLKSATATATSTLTAAHKTHNNKNQVAQRTRTN